MFSDFTHVHKLIWFGWSRACLRSPKKEKSSHIQKLFPTKTSFLYGTDESFDPINCEAGTSEEGVKIATKYRKHHTVLNSIDRVNFLARGYGGYYIWWRWWHLLFPSFPQLRQFSLRICVDCMSCDTNYSHTFNHSLGLIRRRRSAKHTHTLTVR